MARPKSYEPNDQHRAMVSILASLGYGVEDIINAMDLNISRRTFERHYRPELKQARLKAIASIGQMLHKTALGDRSVSAANTWLHWFGDRPVSQREESTGKLSLADLMRDLD